MSDARRVLIVGAKFGEVYLGALASARSKFALAGILSRGSERSRRLAENFGVPIYTSVDETSGKIDFACIVVRSKIVGGDGSDLARAFLKRGVAVLQEHPVHPGDIAALQTLARQSKAPYRVNTFYPYTTTGRRWIAAVGSVLDELGAMPLLARFMTSRQLLYSSLDLICRSLRKNPADFRPKAVDLDQPMQGIALEADDVTVHLLLQTTMHTADPDQHSLVMHQAVYIWPSGYLTLISSHGPIFWTPALHMPGFGNLQDSMYRGPASLGLEEPVSAELSAAPRNWRDAFEVDGATAIIRCLDEMVQDGIEDVPHQIARYQHALAVLWQQVMRCALPIQTMDAPPPTKVAIDRLMAPSGY